MFDYNYEKKIQDLIDKFGLTRKEAEGFLSELRDSFELKQLFDDKKLRSILTLLTILFGLFIIMWLHNTLTKRKTG
ncbi:MAG: hypothetical protein ACUVTB_06145 [Candidatus Bathycorpusculaceae bacterium]